MAVRSLIFLACVASCTAGIAPAPSAPRDAPAGVSIESVDEVARFHVGQLWAPAVEREDGSVVIARTGDANERAWTIDALDEALHARWSVPVAGKVDGLASFEDDRVLAIVDTGPVGQHALEAIVLGGGGEQVARASFTSLIGASCTVGNAFFLGRAGHEIAAQLVCDGKWARVWLDRDLRAVRQTADATLGSMVVPGAWFDDRGSETTIMRDGQRLLGVPKSPTRAVGMTSLAPLQDDLVVAMSINDARDAALRPRYSARGIVRREGAHPWAVDVVDAHLTDDPTTIAGLATTRTGDVMVALGYGRDGRVAGAQLPTPSFEPDARFPDLAERIAIAELDGATGTTRRVLALRPRSTWAVSRMRASVAASAHHVFVQAGEELVVFPRRGAPVTPHVAAVAAPPVPVALPAFDPARIQTVAAGWARVCGPHTVQKNPAPCEIENVALGKDGTIAITGGYYGTNQLDATPLPRRAFESGVIAVFEPGGRMRWHAAFGASWHNLGTHVVVRDDGEIVLTGGHGLGFALGDRRLPDRTVKPGFEFEAISPFLAVFDRDGRVAMLEDVDVLAYGDRSADPTRTCGATLAAGTAPDEVWLRASCADGDRRLLVRGTSVASIEHLPGTRTFMTMRAIDARGTLLDTFTDLFSTSLLVDSGAHRRQVPVFARAELSGAVPVSSATGTWYAAIVPSVTPSGTWRKTIELARIAPDGRVTTHDLVADGITDTGNVWLDGFTVDDRGRPTLSISYRDAFTLAGVALPTARRIGDGDPRGHVIVRLSPDATTIERMLVPEGPRGGCVAPWYGSVKALAARGNTLAVLFEYGVTCTNIKGGPTTLVVYDLGD